MEQRINERLIVAALLQLTNPEESGSAIVRTLDVKNGFLYLKQRLEF